MIEDMIALLFYLRTAAHAAHLRTDSFANHMALGDFYDAIATHADSIAEAWMGRANERIGEISYEPPIEEHKDIKACLAAARTWIDRNRDDKEFNAPELQNLIDGAIDEIDSTLYKLRFLN